MAKVLVRFFMRSFEKEIYMDAENDDEADNYIKDNFKVVFLPEMNRIDYEILAKSEFDPPEDEETNPTT